MTSSRSNQKARTRQAILRAAGVLLARGDKPGLDEIAIEAGVARATAYRYFPGLDALLNEAMVDWMLPDADRVFDGRASADPVKRLTLVDDIFDSACREQEASLRLMLARMLERSVTRASGELPLRQNRRQPMIETALVSLEARLSPTAFKRLVHALSMIVGAEGFIALSDVVGLDEKEARKVRRWAIEALLAAALAKS